MGGSLGGCIARALNHHCNNADRLLTFASVPLTQPPTHPPPSSPPTYLPTLLLSSRPKVKQIEKLDVEAKADDEEQAALSEDQELPLKLLDGGETLTLTLTLTLALTQTRTRTPILNLLLPLTITLGEINGNLISLRDVGFRYPPTTPGGPEGPLLFEHAEFAVDSKVGGWVLF